MQIFRSLNLGLRFALELCMLAALGYAGFHLGGGHALGVALAIAAPLVAAVIWGVYVSPKARVALPRWAWVAVQGALFALAAAGLAAAGHAALGVLLFALFALNLAALWTKD